MTKSRQVLGETGEELAAALLVERGYRNIERNVRLPGGEIDIVAWDGPTLVFIEVRTRRGTGYGAPLESVDRRKQQRLVRLARAYVNQRRLFDVNCRFDVVSVMYRKGAAAPEIKHVIDAFSS